MLKKIYKKLLQSISIIVEYWPLLALQSGPESTQLFRINRGDSTALAKRYKVNIKTAKSSFSSVEQQIICEILRASQLPPSHEERLTTLKSGMSA